MTLAEALTLAVRHHQAGQLDLAASIYQQVLRAAPRQPDALHLLGVIARQRGQYERAIDLMTRAIAVNPAAPDFHCNLGGVYAAVQRIPEAVASYRRAVALNPGHAEAHKNLAETLRNCSELEEALVHARRAVELMPDANTFYCLATVLYQLKDLEAAIEALRQSLERAPDVAAVHNTLASALMLRWDLPGAEQHLRRALELDPYLAAAWTNLGMVLADQERPREAVAAHHKAVRLQPGNSIALCAAGAALRLAGRLDDAADILQQAFERDQTRVDALRQLALVRLEQGRAAQAIACCEAALRMRPDFVEAHDALLVASMFLPGVEARQLAEAQRRWDRQHASHLGSLLAAHENARDPRRRLRVGYVSPNFRGHWQASFLLPLLAAHDRGRFEVFCYSDCVMPDAVTRRARSHADVWREVRPLGDAELAALIRSDGIDILIDPTMHLPGNRALVFARKPAPIQVCWLACPGSTGMGAMDYRLSDSLLDPLDPAQGVPQGQGGLKKMPSDSAGPGSGAEGGFVAPDANLSPSPGTPGEGRGGGLPAVEHEDPLPNPPPEYRERGQERNGTEMERLNGLPSAQGQGSFYAEQSVRLEGAFACYEPPEQTPFEIGSRFDRAAEPARAVTFGCINDFRCVNQEMLQLWSRILQAVPDSRLVISSADGSHRGDALEILRAQGIAPQRVGFIEPRPRDEQLDSFRAIDILLDTLPFNGQVTTLDSLWMGVPVVTLVGDTAGGRVGLSLLTAFEMPQWIAHTGDAYVRIAAQLAGDHAALAVLSTTLRQRLRQSPLMDTSRFARTFESALIAMWQRWCAIPRQQAPAALQSDQGKIPRRIHQLWKTRDLPPRYAAFARTWQRLHPRWEYKLWTDDAIRKLIAERQPGLLAIYDGYASNICRADLGRYVILNEFGGVYVDLDCECLKPIDSLLPAFGLAIASEPSAHATGPLARSRGVERIPCPSFLASEAGNSIWGIVFQALHQSAHLPDPLDATGPFLLARVLADPRATPLLRELPSDRVYPFTREECWSGKIHDLELWEQRTRDAFVLHYWDGTWFGHAAPTGLADQAPVTVHDPSLATAVQTSRVDRDDRSGRAGASPAPRVSCLMVTTGRPEFIGRAIDSFSAQTWPNRELLVVTNQDVQMLRDAVGRATGDVRLLVCDMPDATLGQMRNFAVDRAAGELICIWDDDDVYDPDRLTIQITGLLNTGAAACVLERLLLWWPVQRRMAVSTRRAWEGSLLAWRSAMPRYAELPRGEDTPVTRRLLEGARVVSIDLPRLYVYVIHGDNTTRVLQMEHWWESATARFQEDRCDAVLSELSKRMPVVAPTTVVVNPQAPPAPSGDSSPLISCLMVTRGRPALAIQAVDCFRAQTYRPRELLIVTECIDPALAEHIASVRDPAIRVIQVGEIGLKLGDLRNRAVAEARGNLVCQWDDDDLYDPERLAQQSAALSKTDSGACLLRRWTIWWPQQRRLAVSTPRLWEGSLLAVRSLMADYPSLRRGEDTPVIERLLREVRVVALDEPDLYVYRVHGENAFCAAHFQEHWNSATVRYSHERYEAKLAAMQKRISQLPATQRGNDDDALARVS